MYNNEIDNMIKALSKAGVLTDKKKGLLEEVQKKFNWETVPVIVDRQDNIEIFVGGYTDLVEYLERKEL